MVVTLLSHIAGKTENESNHLGSLFFLLLKLNVCFKHWPRILLLAILLFFQNLNTVTSNFWGVPCL